MSLFSMVLLEEGVEVEFPASMFEALELLHEMVPTFSCFRYGYLLGTVTRAQLRSKWELWVQLVDPNTQEILKDPVGCLDLVRVDDSTVNLKVPPRCEQDFPGIMKYDPEGQLYGSFISQLLNRLQEKDLIELPGVLPLV